MYISNIQGKFGFSASTEDTSAFNDWFLIILNVTVALPEIKYSFSPILNLPPGGGIVSFWVTGSTLIPLLY